MIKYSSKEAKNRFGEFLNTSMREPVTVEKHGKAVAVMLSHEHYKKLKALEAHHEKEQAVRAIREFVQQGLDSGTPILMDMKDKLAKLNAQKRQQKP